MEYWCVIVSGASPVGPFKSEQEANEWAENNNEFKDDPNFYKVEKMVEPY